jgi:hypothetical protein
VKKSDRKKQIFVGKGVLSQTSFKKFLSLLITASFSATTVPRGFAGIAASNGVKSPESPSHEGQIAADRPKIRRRLWKI